MIFAAYRIVVPMVLLTLGSSISLGAATVADLDAAYTAWAQGRPADAIPVLEDAAIDADRWDRWYDLGLARFAAEEPGPAAAALVRAHLLAPDRGEPLRALRELGNDLPTPLSNRLGPVAWPGVGLLAPVLLALAAALLTWALLAPRARRWPALAGALLLAIVLPGQLARWWDASVDYRAVVADSHLLDATGHPLADGMLLAGSVVRDAGRDHWNGRVLVHTLDGRDGWVPIGDVAIEPAVAAGQPAMDAVSWAD